MEFVLPDLSSPTVWMSFLTLTFLEIVLGVDNVIFISIATNKLPPAERKRATIIGLFMAMLFRIALLFGVSALVAMQKPWLTIGSEGGFIFGEISGQSLILAIGGIFLLYKSTTEIHHKLEGAQENQNIEKTRTKYASFQGVIIQIILIDAVFSIDSILTAIGMTTGVSGAFVIIILAIIISVAVMMIFAIPIANFVNKHPTIQMLALAFLILIGFMLVAEGAHLANLSIGGQEVGTVPKGYLYFAIAFSLLVEFLNLRLRRKVTTKPVQLHGIKQEAKAEGILKE